MMSLIVEKKSEENKIKEEIIKLTRKSNENVFFERFERFLMMNAYDLALENPKKACKFLSKEIMKTNSKNDKEKQESFKRIMVEIVTLLVENKYLKIAKTLLTHITKLEDQAENKFINSDKVKLLDSSETLNKNEKEKENDFDAWLQEKENRILMNFAFSCCADGERKKAKSFLRKHICSEKDGIIESEREKILNEAMSYLNNLIKREIKPI